MKYNINTKYTYILLILLSPFFTSCGISSALVSNLNQNITQVNLDSNNFKVVDKVSGSSETSYIMGIGGINKMQTYDMAYSEMIKKANLMDSSKAIANITTEEHISGFAPFYVKRLIIVNAYVIEFTK